MRVNTITTSTVPATRTLAHLLDAIEAAEKQIAEATRQIDQAAAQAVLTDADHIARFTHTAQQNMQDARRLVANQHTLAERAAA